MQSDSASVAPGSTGTRRRRTAVALVAGGNRKVRYRGVVKNNAWLHRRTAALNLRRLLNLGLIRQDGAWALA